MKYLLFIMFMLFSITALANSDAKLEVRNDYSFTIKLEVKCGKWSPEQKRFEYERKFKFPHGKTTMLLVPKQYDRCQIWPSHNW